MEGNSKIKKKRKSNSLAKDPVYRPEYSDEEEFETQSPEKFEGSKKRKRNSSSYTNNKKTKKTESSSSSKRKRTPNNQRNNVTSNVSKTAVKVITIEEEDSAEEERKEPELKIKELLPSEDQTKIKQGETHEIKETEKYIATEQENLKKDKLSLEKDEDIFQFVIPSPILRVQTSTPPYLESFTKYHSTTNQDSAFQEDKTGNWWFTGFFHRLKGALFPSSNPITQPTVVPTEIISPKKSNPETKTPFQLNSNYSIQFSEVTLDVNISSGTFGDVWKGKYKNETVAIKSLKNQIITSETMDLFHKEVKLLSEARHPNISIIFF